MKPLLDTAALLEARSRAGATPTRRLARAALAEAPAPGPEVPSLIALRLAEHVLLAGLPLRHLVPDPALLPPESLRFFALDPDWVEALLDGILSIGLGTDAGDGGADALAAAAAALPAVRDLRRGRAPDAPTTTGGEPRAGDGVCGLLLRSALVERYPGLIVRAWTGTIPDGQDPGTAAGAAPLDPLRLERVTPSILIALWPQAPDVVVLQEPPGALRLGVRGGVIRVRGADGRERTGAGGGPIEVPVPVGAGGVADLGALAGTLAAAGHIPDAGDGAGLAMQLLQPPARRRFRRAAP